MLMVCFTAIMVCTGVGSFVLEHLHQAVKDDCEDGAEKGTQPVDPVVSRPPICISLGVFLAELAGAYQRAQQ
jgi:hypothetical protein